VAEDLRGALQGLAGSADDSLDFKALGARVRRRRTTRLAAGVGGALVAGVVTFALVDLEGVNTDVLIPSVGTPTHTPALRPAPRPLPSGFRLESEAADENTYTGVYSRPGLDERFILSLRQVDAGFADRDRVARQAHSVDVQGFSGYSSVTRNGQGPVQAAQVSWLIGPTTLVTVAGEGLTEQQALAIARTVSA
jgi:hypothetical protein